MNRIFAWIVLAGALLAPASGAKADVTIDMKEDGTPTQIYIAPHEFSAGTPEGRLIFRGDKDILWTVNPAGKTYTEMTKQDIQALASQAQQMMGTAAEAIKNLPPDQRAKVEKMMGKYAPGAQSERRFRPMGEKKTINGFRCTGYYLGTGDDESTEIWTADPKALHLEPSDLSVLDDLASFMQGMPGMERVRDMVKNYARPAPGDLPGFPVLTIARDPQGKETWRSELVSVQHGAVPADRFEVPEGFTRVQPPLPAGGEGKSDQ